MTEEQIATRAQVGHELVDDLGLVLLAEVNEDIAQEDDVDVPIDRVVLVHQVEAVEIGAASQFGDDANLRWRSLAARPEQIFELHVLRDRRDLLGRVDADAGLLEHFGRDIGAKDRIAKSTGLFGDVGKHHGRRVGFSASRTGRAPDLDGG
ncbi:hypothetical protein ASG47_02655 [Devosia sp. Leaf420]|nr:hypothetical protein ASG47_02655 [Devosia sp. Leaf420]